MSGAGFIDSGLAGVARAPERRRDFLTLSGGRGKGEGPCAGNATWSKTPPSRAPALPGLSRALPGSLFHLFYQVEIRSLRSLHSHFFPKRKRRHCEPTMRLRRLRGCHRQVRGIERPAGTFRPALSFKRLADLSTQRDRARLCPGCYIRPCHRLRGKSVIWRNGFTTSTRAC
jgi:hypothetical protein